MNPTAAARWAGAAALVLGLAAMAVASSRADSPGGAGGKSGNAPPRSSDSSSAVGSPRGTRAALDILRAAPRAPASPTIDRGALAATAHAAVPEPPPKSAFARGLVHQRATLEATAAIHGFVDEALAAAGADPWTAQRVHDRVAADAVVAGRRSLPSGAALVRVTVPLAALVAASGELSPRLPWGRRE